MQDIRRVLRAAGKRLLLIGVINWAMWSLTVAMAALILAVLADRLVYFGLERTTWVWMFLGTLGAAALVGALLAVVFRKNELAVARVVDERAGLRESLSTALCVERADDGWSRAVVESANEKARRVVLKDALPIEGPRNWHLPTASCAVLVLAFFLVPQFDLSGALAERDAAREEERQMVEARFQENEADRLIREILAERDLRLAEEEPDPELAADLQKPQSAEDVRKQAIKKLTNLSEQLAEKQNSEEARALETMKDMLRQLKTPGDGALSEFSRELAKGNFEKAQQALEEIAKKLADGEMSEAEKAQLKQQMENMAAQLNQLAQTQQQLEQMLQQAGLTPEQAKQATQSAEAMQQAMQNNPNMSEQQKQQMQQMAQAMQQASSQCQGMGQAMSQMAQSMSQSGQNQQGQQAMDAMSGQLSSMEMMQQDMQAISQQMSQCQSMMESLGQCNSAGWCQGQGQSQMGMTGQWQPGSSLSQGAGSGNAGKGNGAGPDAEESDFALRREKANVNNQGGPIIGSRYVFGEQIKGEAQAEFAAAVEIAAEAAAEDIRTMNVPPELRGSVQHYFGRLQERVKAQRGEAPPASDPAGDN